ncbi:hypothetical protein SOCEGT47_005590 [Sorangium cellulosum]|uniref:Lipoprotein n=1 Tax=Sorangium cellulosum TaxID=56 RepID=A0A4P2PUL2_SORCE|nr:hypothetical protein [Sorangium cellulosum]AUX20096.1 hypothetical protein SOCEGT47_005590 [Sorangium cellulosum]
MHRRSFVAAALLGLAALTGCAPRWRVVTQASPDTFVNQRYFAVLPVDYTGLRVGDQPEAVYLSDQDRDEQQSFLTDKVTIDEEFAKALIERAREEGIEVAPADGPTSAPFLIRPYIASLEPGYYAVVSSKPSRLILTLRITTPDGKVLDEIQLSNRTHAPNPGTIAASSDADKLTSGGRWREDARVVGALAARYLASRVDP